MWSHRPAMPSAPFHFDHGWVEDFRRRCRSHPTLTSRPAPLGLHPSEVRNTVSTVFLFGPHLAIRLSDTTVVQEDANALDMDLDRGVDGVDAGNPHPGAGSHVLRKTPERFASAGVTHPIDGEVTHADHRHPAIA